ncbi:integrase core domain-containing protein [Chloroflexota bacterium]
MAELADAADLKFYAKLSTSGFTFKLEHLCQLQKSRFVSTPTLESAKLFMVSWLAHYNFFRPHMSLKNRTPAQVAGIRSPLKYWKDITERPYEKTARIPLIPREPRLSPAVPRISPKIPKLK